MNFSRASYTKVRACFLPTWIVDSNIERIHRGLLLGCVWKITLFKLVFMYVAVLLIKCGNLYKKLLKPDLMKRAFRFFDNSSLESANLTKKFPGATFLVKFLITD